MKAFEVTRQRLRNQRLVGAPFASPEEVVGWFGAVQAQDFAGARWAIALRMRRAVDREIMRAYRDGAILRTHVLRPTWHFVLPRDLRWLLALTAPRVKRLVASYDRKLGLDERTFRRGNDALTEALAGGKHLTRGELARVLAERAIDTTGQRAANLVMRAELDAVICSGPQRGKQITFALVSERCPPTPPIPRDEALGKLAIRYFTSHGPALAADFAWWSGLTLTDARRAIDIAGPALASRARDDRTYWFTEPARAARIASPVVHLLPNFDEYFIAYKDRSAIFEPAIGRRLLARDSLFASHLVALDGKVIGSWRRTIDPGAVTATTSVIGRLARGQRRALDLAVARLGRFLELPARLVVQAAS